MTLALTLKGCHQLLNLRKQVIVLPHMQDRSLKLTFQQKRDMQFLLAPKHLMAAICHLQHKF